MHIRKGIAMEKMKLLLVDDEMRFLTTTQKLLKKHGYDALIASSGPEALEMLEKNIIHVVVLDVKMPGMDGIQTLREIKSRFPLVEVVMLTGHATVESAVDGLKSGATDYLMKPTSMEELIQKAEGAFLRWKLMEDKIQQATGGRYRTPEDAAKEDG